MKNFDIVIIGGGMVGLAAACGLARSGLQIAIVEPQALSSAEFPVEFDLRVSALSHASQTLLANLNAWPAIEAQRLAPFSGMEVWEADGTGFVEFHAADMGEKYLGWIVENRVVTRALEQQTQTAENITWFNPDALAQLEMTEDAAILTLTSGAVMQAKLVVGADGAHSRVRQLAEFELDVKPYQHHGIVTTVQTELPHLNTARQRFMPTGPLAFLPLLDARAEAGKSGHLCSIVWSAQEDLTQQIM
ncbi:MAG TPA: FAD-dependent oxidoreductase, partial [Pseudomonadales bacterium]|nr:FAD-dependent oxidoreductase [Pseudomonadales bacterium]